ncbi:MAG: SUMF1/EgtB/PvdO family nonheme iron enzyme, partial [Planctomycetes bacterium]|nr:SUMF1/EgtB/PvdO family nonheme iron enzyme [Planctomycetota bacterium]
LRAMTLKRTQKYGIALTGVIAVGLGVSVWFWRDADEQRDAAQKAAVAADDARTLEQAAREQAETNLANFNRLSQFVRLEAAKSSAADLFPAWPEQIAAMREWQEKQARPLREALPGLKDTLQQLEHRALPEQAAGVAKAPQLAAQRAERAAELARMTAKLACWRKAAAVRAGEAKVEEVDLTGGQLPDSTLELNKLAWSLVRPDREDYGREAEGLMIARRALARTEDGDLLRSTVLDTLAWACVAVGLDDEAIAHSEAALAGAPEAERGAYQGMLNRVREQVRNFQIAGFAGVVDDLARNTEELRREVERRATWAFDDDGDTFLHGTLERLIADVQAFLGDEVVDVDRRLSWAERVRELTITRHAARWQEAREAIAKADGTTASTLYAAVPIDLQPQMGLIPLGMNPTTKLWEFYHLRSAWDPAEHADPADVEIPQYRGKAQFDMNGRGLVFVLLPGGTFDMGAQDEDPALPNYDPKADQDEMPVTEVTLDPFFLSKYEMTQGQWARLTNGEWPSWYIVGNGYTGIPVVIMDSHPVEQVDWAMCAELMRRHAMVLPTEAQWEYGCRAGTQWPWSTGPELASLEGYCNVLDQTGSKVEPVWVGGEAWDDGYKGPSPVGTYLPNPFGFYDMHGNMWEWCQDWFGRYTEPVRAGDGLREPEFYEIIRGSRGGGHQSTGAEARSAFRAYRAPNTQVQNQSLRPARRLMR